VPGGELKLGRQEIAIENQRFIGTVAWRQDWQSFDAARAASRLSWKPNPR